MLTITIKGPPKSGKTTTAAAIANMLLRRGDRVQLIDEETAQHPIGIFNANDPTVQIVTERTRK